MLMTVAERIGHLDFEYTPRCEHRQHDNPRRASQHDDGAVRWFLIQRPNECCGYTGPHIFICDTWKARADREGVVRCTQCHEKTPFVGRFIAV